MTADEIIEIAENLIRDHAFSIKDILENTLLIPATLLKFSPTFDFHINGRRRLRMQTHEGFFTTIACENEFVFPKVAGGQAIQNQTTTAQFNPAFRAIEIDTNHLERESLETGMTQEALLEILTLHELVHVAMISCYPPIELGWPNDPQVTFVHEAIALKCGRDLFNDLYAIATQENVQNYLNYVQAQAAQIDGENKYTPFFNEYQNVPTPQFWQTLIAASPVLPAPIQ